MSSVTIDNIAPAPARLGSDGDVYSVRKLEVFLTVSLDFAGELNGRFTIPMSASGSYSALHVLFRPDGEFHAEELLAQMTQIPYGTEGKTLHVRSGLPEIGLSPKLFTISEMSQSQLYNTSSSTDGNVTLTLTIRGSKLESLTVNAPSCATMPSDVQSLLTGRSCNLMSQISYLASSAQAVGNMLTPEAITGTRPNMQGRRIAHWTDAVQNRRDSIIMFVRDAGSVSDFTAEAKKLTINPDAVADVTDGYAQAVALVEDIVAAANKAKSENA